MRERKSWWTWIAPGGIFLALALATTGVAWLQIDHEDDIVRRHTADIGAQMARQIAFVIEARVTVANIFAKRWATHEHRDYSRERFDEFGRVVLAEVPSFQSVHLLAADGAETWRIPEAAPALAAWPPELMRALLDEVTRTGEPVLSQPAKLTPDVVSVLVMVPLHRDAERLGLLVFNLRVDELVSQVLDERMRTELNILLRDGELTLFESVPDGMAQVASHASALDVRTIAVPSRLWRLGVSARHDLASHFAGHPIVPVLLLGFLLCVLFAHLSYLLLKRIDQARAAHAQALEEMQRRESAEQALRASEERYRSVFDSATDGFLVLDDADHIIDANTAACAMHGVAAGELIGRSVLGIIAPNQRHLYEPFRIELMRSGRARLETTDIRADGTLVDVEVRGATVKQGEESRILAILNDVTERKHAEQRLALLPRQILMAQEAERERVARELHDELGQLLTALRLELGWLQKQTTGISTEERPLFYNAIKLVEQGGQEVRRICRGLRPPLLDDLGLEPAIELLVREFAERSGLVVRLEVHLNDKEHRLPPEAALTAYRILQESLTNVSRHAEAKNIEIRVESRSTELELSVYDDGRGFEVSSMANASGVGLAGMRQRAELVHGGVDIRSRLGGGTRVVFRAPLSAETTES